MLFIIYIRNKMLIFTNQKRYEKCIELLKKHNVEYVEALNE